MFPAGLLWNAEFLTSMSCHLSVVTSVAVKHPEVFPLLQRQSLPICRFSKHKWKVMYICLALSTFQVLSYLGYVLFAVKVGCQNSIIKCKIEVFSLSPLHPPPNIHTLHLDIIKVLFCMLSSG